MVTNFFMHICFSIFFVDFLDFTNALYLIHSYFTFDFIFISMKLFTPANNNRGRDIEKG